MRERDVSKRGRRTAAIAALLAAGWTLAAVSRRTGIARSTLHRLAERHGWERRRRARPAKLRGKAERLLYRGNLTQGQTARRLGVAKSTISRWAKSFAAGGNGEATIEQRARGRSIAQGKTAARRVRTAVRCSGCGAKINVLPCLACAAQKEGPRSRGAK